MKPRIDYTKPVQTRAGLPVRLLCTDAKGNFPVVALITPRPDGKEEAAEHYTADGYCYSAGEINGRDLINVPPKHTITLWIVINCRGMVESRYQPPLPSDGFLACKEVNVTITEGEGV